MTLLRSYFVHDRAVRRILDTPPEASKLVPYGVGLGEISRGSSGASTLDKRHHIVGNTLLDDAIRNIQHA